MPCDFTIILDRTVHVGDDPEMSGDVPFEGAGFTATFFCPRLHHSERAVLFFQTRDVDHAMNVIRINDHNLFGGIPVSSTGDAESPIWNGNVVLTGEFDLLGVNDELYLEARNSSGGGSGNVDDFLINNVVILFKTYED